MGASLELLQITGYTDEEFQDAIPGLPYSVMLNPDSVKWGRTISYTEEQSLGSSSPSQKYRYSPNDKLSFDIVIDCTGVVDSTRTNMATEITALKSIVFTFNGQIHRPNFVIIQWGQNITFTGVLSQFDTTYSLFAPDGSPLRAKISLAFDQYISATTVAKLDGEESPDITHLVTVVEGTSLPQLCQQVWNKDSHYIQVARFNDLNKFRHLKPNTQLVFPPIIQPK